MDQPVGVLVEGTWRVGPYVGDLSLLDVSLGGGLSVLSKLKVMNSPSFGCFPVGLLCVRGVGLGVLKLLLNP